MPKPDYFEPEIISLKRDPDLDEGWLQERIADNPKILGLGDLVLKDKERTQPRAGRLDLLLQDPESLRRYEVESNSVTLMRVTSSERSNTGILNAVDIRSMNIVR